MRVLKDYLKNAYLVVADNGRIITTGWRTRRVKGAMILTFSIQPRTSSLMDTLKIDLDRFASIVQESASIDLLATDALLLARDGKLSQYWAPFDHTPRSARLVIVGITPGRNRRPMRYTPSPKPYGAAKRSKGH